MARSSALAALALLSAVTAFAAGSAPPATASGTFEDAKFKLEIGGAYAYWGKTGGFGEDPVIRVAVSNAARPMPTAMLATSGRVESKVFMAPMKPSLPA